MRKGEVWRKGTECLYQGRAIKIMRCYRPITRMLVEFYYLNDPNKIPWYCQEWHFRRNYRKFVGPTLQPILPPKNRRRDRMLGL